MNVQNWLVLYGICGFLIESVMLNSADPLASSQASSHSHDSQGLHGSQASSHSHDSQGLQGSQFTQMSQSSQPLTQFRGSKMSERVRAFAFITFGKCLNDLFVCLLTVLIPYTIFKSGLL